MHMCESQLSSRVLTRCVLVLASMATIVPGAVGSSEAGQLCGDLVEPQDMATISSPAEVPGVYLARINEGSAEHVPASSDDEPSFSNRPRRERATTELILNELPIGRRQVMRQPEECSDAVSPWLPCG